MFGFEGEPFELPSAGFFSLDENQSPLCLDGIRLPLSTTFGGAAGSSTGLSAPGQITPSLCRRYKSFIPDGLRQLILKKQSALTCSILCIF
jgi:hypothetical protein